MNYIEYSFEVSPTYGNEILIAELGEVGFESFVETDKGVSAYIKKSDWNENVLDDIFILSSDEFTISYEIKEIEQVNWNQEWEKNFNPIEVDEICTVRATFHDKPDTKYDIIIQPKMSFGTGHHETTYMMLQHLLKMDLSDKKVLDMGCGTGILAIMSANRGAKSIDAIDIDSWCCENANENIQINAVSFINVMEGDSSLLSGKEYDLIIANINRNILLEDVSVYSKSMKNGSILLLSGFYTEDLPIITAECEKNGLKYIEHIEKNNWVAAKYEKI